MSGKGGARFFDEDKPHSRAKRWMMRSALYAFLGVNFGLEWKRENNGAYKVNYLDAFAG